MKRKIATAAAVLLLAGCGNGDGEPSVPDEPSAEAAPEETAAEVTPEPAPTATLEEPDTEEPAEPARSDRDNLVKALGELGGITDSNGEMLISFWVDEIQVDFECTRDFVEEPQNGHYVGVHFRVETAPGLADDGDGEFWLSPHDMSAWTTSGQRVNDIIGNAFSCPSDAEMLPVQIGPGETAEGWIVLDLPDDAEAVGLTLYTASGRAGWEWLIPS